MEELSSSMSTVTPIASSLGVEFEDIGASLATMTAQGNNTATSTTQLRQMLTELSKAGGETAGIFESMAGKTFKEFIAEGNNLQDALKLMEQYARENNVEINDLFGSVQAGSAALMLTGESAEMFSDNLNNMANSAGATEEAFGTMDEGIGRSIEKLKVSMDVMIMELGESLSPALASVVDYVIEAMPTIQSIVENTFNVIGEVISVFITVIDWLVENITQFVADNEELFNSVAETISMVFDSIVEIVNTFVQLFTEIWDKYGQDIIEFAEKHFEGVKTIIDGVLKIITGIFQAFTALLTGDWDEFGKALKRTIDGVWTAIKGIFETSINAVSGVFKGAISLLSGIAKDIMNGVWNAFKEIWESVTEWIDGAFSNIAEAITGFGSKFFNAGKDIFLNLWDGLKNVWSDISEWVSDKISWLTDKLAFWRSSKDEMNEPDKPRPRGGGSRDIPRYDVGTPFVPTDQLAFIHKGEAVIPAKYNPYNPANNNKSIEPTTQNTNNHYHISKIDFPNVRDAREIENAIGNLSNYATQWAHRIGR